jgi:hypothetical protein
VLTSLCPQLSGPAHGGCRQGKILKLLSTSVESSYTARLSDPQEFTPDFEIGDFRDDDSAAGSLKIRDPQAAVHNGGRHASMCKQAERPRVQHNNGTHHEIPLSSAGNSFRLEVRAASSAWKKS